MAQPYPFKIKIYPTDFSEFLGISHLTEYSAF